MVASGSKTVQGAFLCQEHKLGVAHWCVPIMFGHCNKSFKELHAALPKHCASPTSSQANRTALSPWDTQLLSVSRGLLLISADVYTAWNTR